MSISVIYKAITIITNLVVQQKILITFGSNINGISSSISQFISYLALLEAGIGAASIQVLYKPLNEDNWNEANSILSATNKQYIKISAIFFSLLLVLSCSMPIIVSQQMDAILVVAITFISGLSSFISYLFTGKYTVLLNADKKVSVIYQVDSVLSLLSCGLRLVAIKLGLGIIVVQSILAIISLLKALILFVYVRKKYGKLDLKVKPGYNKIGKHRSVFIHQLAGVVVNHTDITILTVISTLKNVSVYSVYNYIYSNISAIITTTFMQAAQATFGHLTNQEQDVYNDYYYTYEFFFSLLLYIIMTTALILTLPFVTLYTSGVTDINYISASISALFFVNQFMNLIRIPSLVTIQAYGWFKETQSGAIIESIINIVISVILLPVMGINGLLLGTFCAYCYRTQDIIGFIYKQCNLKWSQFIRNNIINIAVSGTMITLLFVIKPIEVKNWFQWLISTVLSFLMVTIVFVIANYLFNRKLFISMIIRLKKFKVLG